MAKNDRERTWKATAKLSDTEKKEKKIVIDDDINNLNDDDSFLPADDTVEKVPLTDEEKKEVRRKLFVLLIVIVIVLLFMLIVLIFDPFNSSDSEEDDTTNTTEVEKEEEKEEEEEVDNSLDSLEDGDIDLTNATVASIIDEIEFRTNEYYDNDTVSLFKNGSSISNLTNANKLLLVSKTSDFNKIINSLVTDDSLCSSTLEIPTSSIDTILKERFNTTISSYDSFVYSYYSDGTFINNVKFVKSGSNDNYIGTCYNISSSISSLAEVSVTSAKKNGDYLYLSAKVAFIKETGVYKDYNFKTLITSDSTATSDDYLQLANTYTFKYNISGSNYYLESISS